MQNLEESSTDDKRNFLEEILRQKHANEQPDNHTNGKSPHFPYELSDYPAGKAFEACENLLSFENKFLINEFIQAKNNSTDEDRSKTEQLEYNNQSDDKNFYNCISFQDENYSENKLDNKKTRYLEFYNKIIIGNKKWVKCRKLSDGNFFEKLAKPQNPKYLVIACSDSRVVVNDFTATDPGEVFTHRNIGNLVISTDFNCQSVLQYAVDYLKVEHILVIGHTDCGAIRAALSYDHHGIIDHWLKNIREVAEKHKSQLSQCDKENEDHENLVKKLIELNVKEQCLNLCKSPIVQAAWEKEQILYVHGLLFEFETGLLKNLNVLQHDWEKLRHIYKYKFKNEKKNN